MSSVSDPSRKTSCYVWVEMADGRAKLRGAPEWRSTPALNDTQVSTLLGAWSWDGTTLTGEVDTFGFFNLYCYEKDGVVALSPSLLELVANGCDTTRDERALAVFHRLGIFVNDDTPLKHVRTLPPGGKLHWQNGVLSITGGADIPKARSITRNDAVEGMIDLFRASMKRTLASWDGALYLPLSGGRDSRHILLEMLHQSRAPEACVTFHHNGAHMNAEALSARAVCERKGVRHDVLGYARPRLADATRALTMTSLCADEHAQMMPLHDYFIGRDGAAFDGLAGDILTNPDNDADRFFKLSEKGNFTAIARAMMEGHGRVISQGHWGQGAGPLYSPGWDEDVVDYVGHAIAEYADAPDPYQNFWLYHRTRREINFVPQAILSQADTVFCPYLDEDFARFCLSLPYDVTKDQKLHDDAIARAYPDVADIPFQEGFKTVPSQSGGLGHKMRSLGDVQRISRMMWPNGQLDAMKSFLRPPKQLNRGSGDVYRLHDACLDGLDATRARALLDFATQLEAARSDVLISDAI